MHIHTLKKWQHNHDFSALHEQGERRTTQVLILTAVTMIVEIFAGTAYKSMALLADGWHMGTHGTAFLITIFAYRYARENVNNQKFAFGTGKISVLGGFASAIILAIVALVMFAESIKRVFSPQIIQFNEAIVIAILGLFINATCATILQDRHKKFYQDHNYRAAYLHVLADALTSVFAIIALISGKYFGWAWLDPIMGMVGAVIIIRWTFILLRETGPILLDKSIEDEYKFAIKEKIEKDADNLVSDIHIWKVGTNHYATILSLVTHSPKSPEHYKKLLANFNNLSHVTIEVNHCSDDSCLGIKSNVIKF
jgi:cation diffusion facilitator family transporter